MFTQCPKCAATFRITAEQLKQAEGRVRCGKCQHVYDALNPDDLPTAKGSERLPSWLNASDEIDDPENISHENSDHRPLTVDDIAEAFSDPESTEKIPDDGLMDDAFDEEASGTIIHIEGDEEDASGDTDEGPGLESNTHDPLEFNVPKQQWGRFFTGDYEGPIIEAVGPLHEDEGEPEIFVDSPEIDVAATDTEIPDDEETHPKEKTSSLRTAIDNLTMEKSEWQRLHEDADNEADALFMVEPDEIDNEDVNENSNKEETDDTGVRVNDEDNHRGVDDNSEAEATIPADNQQHAVEQINRPTEADLGAPPLWAKPEPEGQDTPRSRRGFAAIGLLLLLIMLAIQLMHHNREKLATDPRYGETVRSVYASLDRPLYPAWELSAYKIRGTKAISGESNGDMLDIRAQLAVTGDKPMGEPQIRVILKDRWGKAVNDWLFSADEYMPGMRPPNGLIQPGTITPIKLSVVDLGSKARGFQLEICLLREGGVLQCDGQL